MPPVVIWYIELVRCCAAYCAAYGRLLPPRMTLKSACGASPASVSQGKEICQSNGHALFSCATELDLLLQASKNAFLRGCSKLVHILQGHQRTASAAIMCDDTSSSQCSSTRTHLTAQ